VKFGGRRPPFPDAELIRSLAAVLTETGLTEIEYAMAVASPAAVPPTSAELAGAVKAPMVGTAYLAPQPGELPFVRLGDIVTEGQPLLIIEAMKVMNEIRAHRPGRIAQILVVDAQPVEYGAILMLIE